MASETLARALLVAGSPAPDSRSAALLAADHSLAPVLDSLAARRRLPTVFATDAQLVRAGGAWRLAADIETRLQAVAADLAFALEGERELQRLRAAAAEPARCSA